MKKIYLICAALGAILPASGCSAPVPLSVQTPGFEVKDEGRGGTDRSNFVTQADRGPGEGGLWDSLLWPQPDSAERGPGEGGFSTQAVKNTDIHDLS